MTRRFARRATFALLLFVAAACDNSPTQPSLFTTETFTGSVAPQGFVSHTFVTQQSSPTIIRMATFNPQLNMGLALGTPFGSNCSITLGQAVVKQGDEFQIQLEPSTYCVMVFDIGNVAATTTVSYSMVVQHR